MTTHRPGAQFGGRPDNRPRLAGQLENVQAGVGAVRDIDVAAVVGLGVVALDRRVAAALLAADHAAALHRRLADRRNEVGDFLRLIRIAHVEHADPGIEEGDEGQLLIVGRAHVLVRGMRAEPPSPGAEIPARLRHRPVRHHHRGFLDGRVHEPHHLPRLAAFLAERLVDDHHELAVALVGVLGEFLDLDPAERHRGMRADQRRHLHERDLRIARNSQASAPSVPSAASRGRGSAAGRRGWCRRPCRCGCPSRRSTPCRGRSPGRRRLRPAAGRAARSRGS